MLPTRPLKYHLVANTPRWSLRPPEMSSWLHPVLMLTLLTCGSRLPPVAQVRQLSLLTSPTSPPSPPAILTPKAWPSSYTDGRPRSLHSPLADRITVGVSTLFLTCSCSLKDQEDCLFPLLIHATNICGQPVQSYLKKICNEKRQSGKYDHIRFSLWGHFRFPYRHPDIPNIRLHTHI